MRVHGREVHDPVNLVRCDDRRSDDYFTGDIDFAHHVIEALGHYPGIYDDRVLTLLAEEIEQLKKLWWEVHKEDHEMCERLQRGRNSPVSDDGGVLSPVWEDSVRAFQDLVIQSVSGR